MEKYKQIKKKHHYVWAYHLKQWATGNDVFYITKTGKIACDSVKGLSQERGFYKINPLQKKDVEYLTNWSKTFPKHLHEQHMRFLKDFIGLSYISNTIQKRHLKTEEVKNLDLAIQYNSFENLHTSFECGVLPVMKELHKGSEKILAIKEYMIDFCSYVGLQFTRTKTFKEKSIAAIKTNSFLTAVYPDKVELTERNWWFISFMLGINVGFSLFSSRAKNNHIFICNDTEIPFITSDNPVINIHPSLAKLSRNEAPKNLDLYFPISPRYAYMINESTVYDELSDSIEETDVQKLNSLMARESDQTIYGNSKEILETVKVQHKST